ARERREVSADRNAEVRRDRDPAGRRSAKPDARRQPDPSLLPSVWSARAARRPAPTRTLARCHPLSFPPDLPLPHGRRGSGGGGALVVSDLWQGRVFPVLVLRVRLAHLYERIGSTSGPSERGLDSPCRIEIPWRPQGKDASHS